MNPNIQECLIGIVLYNSAFKKKYRDLPEPSSFEGEEAFVGRTILITKWCAVDEGIKLMNMYWSSYLIYLLGIQFVYGFDEQHGVDNGNRFKEIPRNNLH